MTFDSDDRTRNGIDLGVFADCRWARLAGGELFFPTGGILFLTAAMAIAAGVVMTFYYGDTATGLLTLIGGLYRRADCELCCAATWPRTSFGKQLVLASPSDDDATIASSPALLELEGLRGRYGRAISDLRPAGAAEFDGNRRRCVVRRADDFRGFLGEVHRRACQCGC